MMRTRRLAAFVLLIIPFVPRLHAQNSNNAFNPDSVQYLWPTNASHALSGMFAETRSGHFHAALDIKTWGRRGYPVYATRSGKLYRMAIGPTGYGKVLYLKHDDGSFSVYAHLLRFNEQLRQIADSIRFSDYSASFDMVVDSMDIYVGQGEQIALSGASGIGPPHLHFELRTPNEEPFNPLLTNLEIKDTIPPSFSGLAIIPLSVTSKIEGQNHIYTKEPDRKGNYTNFGTIEVSGPVGLAADLFDQANDVPNVYAVYRTSLKVDGREVFSSRVNRFSYEETDQLHLDRVYPLLQSAGRGFQRLYIEDGNTLPFYQTRSNGGQLNLSPGKHNIEIVATDIPGNSRRATFTLEVDATNAEPASSDNRLARINSTKVDPNEWNWFNNWVNIPSDEFRQLTLYPMLNVPFPPVYYDNGESISVALNQGPQYYFQPSPTDYFIANRSYPNEPTYLFSPDNQVQASFPRHTFYDTTSVALTKQVFSADSIQIDLIPDSTPIRKKYRLSIRLDSAQAADATLSFYRVSQSGKSVYKLKTQRIGIQMTAKPSVLGQFMVLSDTEPPEVSKPRIIQSPDGFWLVYIPVDDNRSGTDYQRSTITVNGVRGLTEYEPEDNRLVYYHPDFVPESTNRIEIAVYDKTGNKTTQLFMISH